MTISDQTAALIQKAIDARDASFHAGDDEREAAAAVALAQTEDDTKKATALVAAQNALEAAHVAIDALTHELSTKPV